MSEKIHFMNTEKRLDKPVGKGYAVLRHSTAQLNSNCLYLKFQNIDKDFIFVDIFLNYLKEPDPLFSRLLVETVCNTLDLSSVFLFHGRK